MPRRLCAFWYKLRGIEERTLSFQASFGVLRATREGKVGESLGLELEGHGVRDVRFYAC